MTRAAKNPPKTDGSNGRPHKKKKAAAAELPSRFYGTPLPGRKTRRT